VLTCCIGCAGYKGVYDLLVEQGHQYTLCPFPCWLASCAISQGVLQGRHKVVPVSTVIRVHTGEFMMVLYGA
jgi:hypothetical protein